VGADEFVSRRWDVRANCFFFSFSPPPPPPLHGLPQLPTSTPHNPLAHILPTVTLNGNRVVTGILRGFDQFMNLVLDGAVDEKARADMGMVVIRGASVVTIEALEFVPAGDGGGGGGGA